MSKTFYPGNQAYKKMSNGYSIMAGPSIFLTKEIAIEFIAGYKHTTSDDFDQTKTGTINTTLGLQVHFENAKSKS